MFVERVVGSCKLNAEPICIMVIQLNNGPIKNYQEDGPINLEAMCVQACFA